MSLGRLVGVALVICAVAGAITLAIDPQDDGPDSSNAAPKRHVAASTGKAKSAPPAFHGRTATVRMDRLAFAPAKVHIKVGDRIEWRNGDNVVHNVTTENDPTGQSNLDLQSASIEPGSSWSYVARFAGTAAYVCTIHPTTMRGTIVVDRAA